MRKIFVSVFLLGLAGALAGLIAWSLSDARKHPASQLTLPDGSVVHVIAATYGRTNYSGSRIATFLLTPFPYSVQQKIWRWSNYRIFSGTLAFMSFTPPTDLNVFMYRRTNAATHSISAYYEAFLADDGQFISGSQADLSLWYGPNETVGPIHFPVFPHRSKKLTMHIFYYGPTGKATNCGSLVIDNPLFNDPRFQSYPVWQPEPLPATKQTGDLEATLVDFHTGFDGTTGSRTLADGRIVQTHGTNRLDGRTESVLNLKLRPLTDTNESWQATGVELFDATGNHVPGATSTTWNGSAFSFTPSLWPDEPAWKIKLLLKKNHGFHPDELVVVKGVALGEVNQVSYIGRAFSCSGVTVTFDKFNRRPPLGDSDWSSANSSAAIVTTSDLPAGTYFDLVDVVFDTGKTNHAENSSTANTVHTYTFHKVPEAVKTADFIFAVHQGRSVEFMVKPELPAGDYISK